MDKTRDSTNSKIWPDSTCAISVRRKGQILLVVESLVLSTTDDMFSLVKIDIHPFVQRLAQWTTITKIMYLYIKIGAIKLYG